MTFTCLNEGDLRRKGLRADWAKWLRSADELYVRFFDRLDGWSPFDFHEVASVGFLSNAAALAGYVPLSEYDIIKRGKLDKRTKVAGRADLWFDAGERKYSFEFKKTIRPATTRYLEKRLLSAYDDVKCVQKDEYQYAAACLVTVAREEDRIKTCRDFADSPSVDFAYSIGPDQEPAFVFFKLKV